MMLKGKGHVSAQVKPVKLQMKPQIKSQVKSQSKSQAKPKRIISADAYIQSVSILAAGLLAAHVGTFSMSTNRSGDAMASAARAVDFFLDEHGMSVALRRGNVS